jgi:hypothetical protein
MHSVHPQHCGRQLVLLAVIAFLLPCSAPGAESASIVAPLTGDGYLWAPPPNPLPRSGVSFQFDFNYHQYDYDIGGSDQEVTFASFQFILGGEITLLDVLTIGLDLPFLYVHSMDTSDDVASATGADIGNLRLHTRASFVFPDLGLVITPAFRVWLPTNTFLTLEGRGSILGIDFDFDIEMINALAIFEPMLEIGWGQSWFSVLVQTGPKFVVVDDEPNVAWGDDFTMWGWDLVLGAKPLPGRDDLQLVLEFNGLAELDGDDAPKFVDDEHVVPLALSLGGRFRAGNFLVGLTFRIGLHQADIYFGDFNLALTLAYLFGT